MDLWNRANKVDGIRSSTFTEQCFERCRIVAPSVSEDIDISNIWYSWRCHLYTPDFNTHHCHYHLYKAYKK